MVDFTRRTPSVQGNSEPQTNPGSLDFLRWLQSVLTDSTECEVNLRTPRQQISFSVTTIKPKMSADDPVAADIIETLKHTGTRLTTTKLLSVMENRNMIHGESTVKSRLATMVKAGILSNVQPGGYAISSGVS